MRKKRHSAKANSHAYHHGNLRLALVKAGFVMVEADGIDSLSLRAVARRARVSHTAPYHHFKSKAELLAAVAAAGFDRLVETIAQQMSRVRTEQPLERLGAVGRGYILFAVTHPSVFRLMFRPELTRPSEHALLMQAEARAFGTLMDTIVACQQHGQLPATDPRPMAALCWSTVHGLAMLHIDGVLGETPIGELRFEKLAEAINNAVVSGLKAHAWV